MWTPIHVASLDLQQHMKRMRAAVNANDRIVIDIIDRKVIQYILVEAKIGKETLLRNPIDFLLSVKKYFGSNGKTIRELYDFKSWHNRKLETEMKRIWSVVDKQRCMKIDKAREQEVLKYVSYDDERAA